MGWFVRVIADNSEAAEKKAAQDRYQKAHAQGEFCHPSLLAHRLEPNPPGKTAEAKSDLARLQEVRRRREAAAAEREAEAKGEFACLDA